MTTRVAIVTEIPAPYRIALFNSLAGRDEIELLVVFLRAGHPARPHRLYADEHRFAWTILRGLERTVRDRWLVVNSGVLATLRRFRPDVIVVGGWHQVAFWQALAYARLRDTPVIAWVESTARDDRSESTASSLAKRLVTTLSTAFLVPGRAAQEYVTALGVAADRIVVAPNAVDLAIFGDAVAAARTGRDDLRRELELRRCTFLSVGRLGHEKGVDILLHALDGVDADVVVAGDGPERARLEALAPQSARFLGWVDRDGLVPWYAAADAFVLPSRSEPWGMGLNEAAAAGLALVATDAAGAAHDLIEEGANGFRVPADDVGALRTALARLAADEGLRDAAGKRSLEVSERFTPDAWSIAVAALARHLAASVRPSRRH